MIDWYVLLVPLALVPIALLFVFVGCDINNEEGQAHKHTLVLHYENIPKKTKPLASVTATFSISDSTVSPPSPPQVTENVAWNGGTITTGILPTSGEVIFWAASAVDCTCAVTLGITDGWPITVAPATALGQTDDVIDFKLTYVEWAPAEGESPPPEYQAGAFQLVELKP
jgi:hypothetical protein